MTGGKDGMSVCGRPDDEVNNINNNNNMFALHEMTEAKMEGPSVDDLMMMIQL